jgi:hypothetical protein
MGLPGVTDQTVYRSLNDVLTRQPEITTVQYEPDSISKEWLRATIAPARVHPPTGPTTPELRVEWRFHHDESYYRIHYHDPNTGFNCGWHRDDDHPTLGPVHFQYEHPPTGASDYESAQFSKTVPTQILWTAVEHLFEAKIPTLSGEH